MLMPSIDQGLQGDQVCLTNLLKLKGAEIAKAEEPCLDMGLLKTHIGSEQKGEILKEVTT